MRGKADVLICGTGPSAAYAVMACVQAGVSFEVKSNRVPSAQAAGAFFLHWLPAWMESTPEPVAIMAVGDADGYLNKQWGKNTPNFAAGKTESSFPRTTHTKLWHSSAVLEALWESVYTTHSIAPVAYTLYDNDLRDLAGHYRWVFHTFPSEASRAGRQLVHFPTFSHPRAVEGKLHRIIYDGSSSLAVRTTYAWGRLSVEFPAGTAVERLDWHEYGFTEVPNLVQLRDLPPDTRPVYEDEWLASNVVPLGRYAAWDRKVLSHDAFELVSRKLGITHSVGKEA